MCLYAQIRLIKPFGGELSFMPEKSRLRLRLDSADDKRAFSYVLERRTYK